MVRSEGWCVCDKTSQLGRAEMFQCPPLRMPLCWGRAVPSHPVMPGNYCFATRCVCVCVYVCVLSAKRCCLRRCKDSSSIFDNLLDRENVSAAWISWDSVVGFMLVTFRLDRKHWRRDTCARIKPDTIRGGIRRGRGREGFCFGSVISERSIEGRLDVCVC